MPGEGSIFYVELPLEARIVEPDRETWKNNMARPKYLECMICGKQQPYEPFEAAICNTVRLQWLEGRYDYDAFKREILRGLPGRPLNLWRYQDILPRR